LFNKNRKIPAANAFRVYLEPKERLWWLQISFSPSPCTPHSHWGAISVSSNPVAGSDGPLRGGGNKWENGRNGKKKKKEKMEKKEKKGTEGWEKTPPK